MGDSNGIYHSDDLNRRNFVYCIAFLAGWNIQLRQGIHAVTSSLTPKTTLV